MSYHKTPTPTRYGIPKVSPLSADEDIVRAFCEKGLKTYNNGYLGPTTCETVWFLPRTYEKKIKNLELV